MMVRANPSEASKSERAASLWDQRLSYLDSVFSEKFGWICTILLTILACTSIFVIEKVRYTEIDWSTYMQQIQKIFVDHERNYEKVYGDTGPIVYPAGYAYIFGYLYYITDQGRDIHEAQYLFLGLLLYVNLVVFLVYRRTHESRLSSVSSNRIPLYIIVALILSRRIISLFVLRLFNDCFEIAFVYTSILLFSYHQWTLGCIAYSLAVSVKMNGFLYAPALFVLLLRATGVPKTIMNLSICAVVQLVLGIPFLMENPTGYFKKAFELSRVFLHKWSVNGAFLREDIFVSKKLALILLGCHLGTVIYFAITRWSGLYTSTRKKNVNAVLLDPDYIVTSMFTCNFVGMVFSRTIHYQFYTWYFHTLPLLLWKCRGIPTVIRIAILVCIELVYNIYPPHPIASLVLHACHFTILIGIFLTKDMGQYATSVSLAASPQETKTK